MTKEWTINQASVATGYAKATLQEAAKSGKITARKVDGLWYVEANSAMAFGKHRPHKKKRVYKKAEPVIAALDLKIPEKEFTPDDLVAPETSVTEPAESPEEFTLDDLVTPATIADEVEVPKEWMTNPIFTYEDLLEQYRRGFVNGFIAGRSVGNDKE